MSNVECASGCRYSPITDLRRSLERLEEVTLNKGWVCSLEIKHLYPHCKFVKHDFDHLLQDLLFISSKLCSDALFLDLKFVYLNPQQIIILYIVLEL